jgi:hypothetical protein
MKKRIYLALLPIAMLWCGCSEKEYEHTREITAMASAADVTVSGSTRAPIDGGSFNGKKARVVATTTSYNYLNLYCNGDMTFGSSSDVAIYETVYAGNSAYPADESNIYLCGLYPHDVWSGFSYNNDQIGAPYRLTAVVDGRRDIMFASETVTGFNYPATLIFKHQLTLLKIKLVKLGTADIIVRGVKLIRTGDVNGYVHNMCSVFMNYYMQSVSFSGGGEQSTMNCYLTSNDAAFIDKDIEPKKSGEAEVVAYVLAPPLKAAEVAGSTEDYTFEVEFTVLGKTLKKNVNVNLKNDSGGNFGADTRGRSFEITLNFSIGDVSATAQITPWVDVTVNNGQVVLPKIPTAATDQEDTGAPDNLTNCYMVKPGNDIVFPVLRAYEFDEAGRNFTTTLRSTGFPYEGAFSAKVLWKDADVMLAPPVVIGTGMDALVWVRTTPKVQGNAVVAIINNKTNKIVWSYHLWVTDIIQQMSGITINAADYKHVIFAVDIGDVLTSGGSYKDAQLYYMWGRKDPFGYEDLISKTNGVNTVASTDYTRDYTYSILNPRTALTPFPEELYIERYNPEVGWWRRDERKSINDPCPGASLVVGRSGLDIGLRKPGFSWQIISPPFGYYNDNIFVSYGDIPWLDKDGNFWWDYDNNGASRWSRNLMGFDTDSWDPISLEGWVKPQAWFGAAGRGNTTLIDWGDEIPTDYPFSPLDQNCVTKVRCEYIR